MTEAFKFSVSCMHHVHKLEAHTNRKLCAFKNFGGVSIVRKAKVNP